MLAQNRWPWRLHATYDETITRALDVFEKVNRGDAARRPALVLRPCRDDQRPNHRPDRERSAAASPSSTAWPIRANTSSSATAPRPPSARRRSSACWTTGVPVGAGTDATRVASYNPWVSLSWLVTGKTVGGLAALSRSATASTARRRCGCGPRTSPGSPTRRARRAASRSASLPISPCWTATTSQVPEDEIRHLQSVLTIVGGKPVYGAGDFADLAPPPPPAMPDWSPVRTFGGYHKQTADAGAVSANARRLGLRLRQRLRRARPRACDRLGRAAPTAADVRSFWGALGCACWAF